jgi:hypothetical protein
MDNIHVYILGFKYTNKQIACVIYDIFRVYEHLTGLGYPCSIITDVSTFRYDRNDYNMVLRGNVDKELLSFINKIKKKPEWYYYCYDFKTFMDAITKINTSDRGIFYYTGHGKKKGIEFPNGTTLSYQSLRNIIEQKIQIELIMLFDCCHTNNMGLSFSFDGKIMKKVNNIPYNKQAVNTILITSSDSTQKSSANKHTSLFTGYLLQFLKMKDFRSFDGLIEFITSNIAGHNVAKQSIQIYSSNFVIPIVPSYLFTNVVVSIDALDEYVQVIQL